MTLPVASSGTVTGGAVVSKPSVCVCVCVCVGGWVFYLSTYYYTHNRTLLPVTSSGTVIGGAMVRSVCVCGVCGCVPVWWCGGGCSVYTCTFRTIIN